MIQLFRMDKMIENDVPNGNIGPKCNYSRCSDSEVVTKPNLECTSSSEGKFPGSNVDTNINCKAGTLNGYRFSKVCICYSKHLRLLS